MPEEYTEISKKASELVGLYAAPSDYKEDYVYYRIINFTLLAPSLWTMINQFNIKDNKNITIIKIADNKGVIIKVLRKSRSLAGKQTTILVAMQSLKAQAMASLVEEGLEI